MYFLPESVSVFRFSEGFSVLSEGLPEDAGVVLPRPSRFPAGRRGREGAGGKGSVPYPDGASYRNPRGAGGPLGRAVPGGSSCRPGLSGCRVPAGRPDASARGAKAGSGRRTAYICLRFIFRGVFHVLVTEREGWDMRFVPCFSQSSRFVSRAKVGICPDCVFSSLPGPGGRRGSLDGRDSKGDQKSNFGHPYCQGGGGSLPGSGAGRFLQPGREGCRKPPVPVRERAPSKGGLARFDQMVSGQTSQLG